MYPLGYMYPRLGTPDLGHKDVIILIFNVLVDSCDIAKKQLGCSDLHYYRANANDKKQVMVAPYLNNPRR